MVQVNKENKNKQNIMIIMCVIVKLKIKLKLKITWEENCRTFLFLLLRTFLFSHYFVEWTDGNFIENIFFSTKKKIHNDAT